MQTKHYGLIDCNNFFASCERAFNPRLKNKPIIVLSNNDGCIVARSNEAKKFGIGMGVPLFKCKDIVEENEIKVFSSNFTLYGDLSKRIMNILSEYVQDVQVYSIDEAFFSISGVSSQRRQKIIEDLSKVVEKSTGIPVSVGLSKSKTLAKLSAEQCKGTGNPMHFLDTTEWGEEEMKNLLMKTELEDIWGIGRRVAPKLKAVGIENAYDLINADATILRNLYNVSLYRTQLELRGISCIELVSNSDITKSIACTRSFGHRLTNYKEIEEAVFSYTSNACERLRRYSLYATNITVFLLTNPFCKKEKFYYGTYTESLLSASSSTYAFSKLAMNCLKKIFIRGLEYKKAGVIITGIFPEESIQRNFLVSEKKEKISEKIMYAIDKINNKYFRAIYLAGCGVNKKWEMKSSMRSPCYTTEWNELPVV